VDALRERATISAPLRDLAEVLSCFTTLQSVLCSFSAIRRVAFENVEDAWRDGVKLVELRFAPAFIAAGKRITNDEILAAVLAGVAEAVAAYPIRAGLIGILARGRPLAENRQAAADMLRWKEAGKPGAELLCGLDLADAEDGSDPRDFAPLVDSARNAGLGITVHTGENTGPGHIRTSLDVYRPQRIGHGIRAWGDGELLRRLRDEGVLLEVCPTSNWLTSSVPSLKEHPLPHLYRADVPVSINSDDPHLFGIDLVREYEVCRDLYGFTGVDFTRINRMALAHSFLPREAKERVRAEWFAEAAATG
jgi:adenosine deaminase